jgi:hypothetical protein
MVKKNKVDHALLARLKRETRVAKSARKKGAKTNAFRRKID